MNDIYLYKYKKYNRKIELLNSILIGGDGEDDDEDYDESPQEKTSIDNLSEISSETSDGTIENVSYMMCPYDPNSREIIAITELRDEVGRTKTTASEQCISILSQLNAGSSVALSSQFHEFVNNVGRSLEIIKKRDKIRKNEYSSITGSITSLITGQKKVKPINELKCVLPKKVGMFPNKTIPLNDKQLMVKWEDSEVSLFGNIFNEGRIFRSNPTYVSVGTSGKARGDDVTLVNMYDVIYKREDKEIKSFRYGTPLGQDKQRQHSLVYNHLNGADVPDLSKKIIIISLLDTCKQTACDISRSAGNISKGLNKLDDKIQEMGIIQSEIEYYKNKSNVVFFHVLINSMVNNEQSLTIETNASSDVLTGTSLFRSRFSEWIRSISNFGNFLATMFNNLFGEEIRLNVTPQTLQNILNAEFRDRLTSFNVKGSIINVVRELARYYSICFISLIQNLLSLTKNITIAYHCKSGQDRTGTFYAINQMVTHIFNKRKEEILADLTILSGCTGPECLKRFMLFMKKYFDNVNNVELLRQHLFMAYVITWLSTGIGGIKWSLGKKEAFISIENKFSYLMTRNPEEAKYLEGNSMYRGS